MFITKPKTLFLEKQKKSIYEKIQILPNIERNRHDGI